MKNLVIIFTIIGLISTAFSADITSQQNGNWGSASTWVGGVIPTASDNVTINHNITIEATGFACNNLIVNSGRQLIFSVNSTKTFTVNGDLLNNGLFGTDNPNTGNNTVIIKGNISNNGNFKTIQGNSSTNVTLNGLSTQYISGSSVIAFQGLTINNTSNISLNNNITVNGSLTLTSGTIFTNNYSVTLATTGTINTTGNGRIEGTVTKNIISGTTGIIRLMAVNNYVQIQTTPTPSITSITIKSYPNTLPPDVRPEYDPSLGVNRYYEITNVTGSGAASLRLDYLASEMGGSFTPATGNIWQYLGTGPWVDQGGINQSNYYTQTPVPISSSNLVGKYAIADAASAMPVQLAFFVAYTIGSDKVTLEWETVSEINNYGFYVEKYNHDLNEYVTIEESFQPGAGTTVIPQRYSWTDNAVTGNQVEYRLLQIDLDGLKNYSNPIIVMLNPNSTGDNESIPAEFALKQNYPNPFNPTTKISFSLAREGFTTLKIYNLLGEEVATLFSGIAKAGKLHSIEFNAANLPSGVYISRLQSGNDIQTRKMMLMK